MGKIYSSQKLADMRKCTYPTRMLFNMIDKMIFPCKCFGTVSTFEWFLSAVLKIMVDQMILSCKCFGTKIALERLLSGMLPDMV